MHFISKIIAFVTLILVIVSIFAYQSLVLDYQWNSPEVITVDRSQWSNLPKSDTLNLFFQFNSAEKINLTAYIGITTWI